MKSDFKIAIQLFGQLRMWEDQEYLKPFISFLKEQASSVDVFGSFWNDEYSQQNINKYNTDIFTEYELVPIPDKIFKGLWRWGYCLLKSRNLRYRYQFKNNKRYDLVIMMRPDLYIKIAKPELLERFLNSIVAKKYLYKIWTQKVISNSSVKPFDVDDKCFYATPEAADIFCLGFNHIHNNPENNSHSAYHTDPVSFIKTFNLIVEPFNIIAPFANFNLIRHQYLAQKGLTTEKIDDKLKSLKTLDEVKNLVKEHL